MEKLSEIEEMFLDAEKAFDEGNHREGKRILEAILTEEPSFGRAHNFMGWLYRTKYENFKMAEKHFKLALKFDPDYPSAYLNYAYLLRDLGRLNDMEALLEKALETETVNKCGVYDEYGSLYELRGQYNKAISFYRKAVRHCLNDKVLDELRKHIKRCRKKKSMFNRFRRFIERVDV
jgi:tetratricopeptide (TPR) repeat protein